MNLKSIFKDFLNLFFPNSCIFCDNILDENDKYICEKCSHNLKKTDFHKFPSSNELFCELYKHSDIERAFSLFYFEEEGVLQALIHKLKYDNKPDIGIFLGEMYGKILNKETDFNFDLIIPVPLHKNKLKLRGYNQSERIAVGLNLFINAEIDTTSVIRRKNTKTQTAKNKFERRFDMIDAFDVVNPLILKNKKILIVDDVITSGSTIIECVKTIKNKIECKISICSIGRTL